MASVARRPGLSVSWLRSMVSVSPPAPSGRSIVSASFSPGQGRHSRRRVPAAGASIAGMPSAVACHSGLGSSRQTSLHATSRGASSASFGASASTLLHAAPASPGASVTSARPSATRTPAVVTDSPASSGTSSTIAPSGGATRSTSVVTCQRRPSESVRTTLTKGGIALGSSACASGAPVAAAGAASRASWSAPDTRPAASMPSTVQPRGAPISSTRCGRERQIDLDVRARGQRAREPDHVAARREPQPELARGVAAHGFGGASVHDDGVGREARGVAAAAARQRHRRLGRDVDAEAQLEPLGRDREREPRGGRAARRAARALEQALAQLLQQLRRRELGARRRGREAEREPERDGGADHRRRAPALPARQAAEQQQHQRRQQRDAQHGERAVQPRRQQPQADLLIALDGAAPGEAHALPAPIRTAGAGLHARLGIGRVHVRVAERAEL